MNMSSTYFQPAAFSVVNKPSFKHKYNSHKRLQVRAQRCRDEGRSNNNMVDANLRVLKERIDVVKMKERLKERCCRHDHQYYINGWNYAAGNSNECSKLLQIKDTTSATAAQISHDLFELVGLVGGFFSLTIFSGTVGLCLVSLFVHLNQ